VQHCLVGSEMCIRDRQNVHELKGNWKLKNQNPQVLIWTSPKKLDGLRMI
jgi:hypothetical protein